MQERIALSLATLPQPKNKYELIGGSASTSTEEEEEPSAAAAGARPRFAEEDAFSSAGSPEMRREASISVRARDASSSSSLRAGAPEEAIL